MVNEQDATTTVVENAGEVAGEVKVDGTESVESGAVQTDEQKAKAAEDESSRKTQEAKDHKAKTEARINHKIALAKAEAAKEKEAKHAAELKLARAEGELEAMRKMGTKPGIDADAPPVKPKMDDFETLGEFNAANTEYLERRQDWLLEQDRANRKKEMESITRTLPRSETPEQAKAREMDVKVATVQSKLIQEFGEDTYDVLFDENGNGRKSWPCTGIMAEAIVDSENATKVLAYFADNPQVSAKIAALPQWKQGAEIENLAKTLNTKRETAAPAPITQVQGKSAGGVVDESKMSDEEYTAWRKKQKLSSA